MPDTKRDKPLSGIRPGCAERGFSLVELMVTMTIFGILMTGVFQAYLAQMQHATREYTIAESDIDRQVGQGVIARDIFMAGYGLADDYGGAFTPWALLSTDGGSGATDDLTLMGTALGLNSQQAQHWSYVASVDVADKSLFTPKQWLDEGGNADARENLQGNDMVVLIEAGTKRLLDDGSANASKWLFQYVDADGDPVTVDDTLVTSGGGDLNPVPNGAVIYSLYQAGSGVVAATQPYYAVRYYLSTADGNGCATGVKNLLRIESRTTQTPSGSGAEQMIPCVADFEVAIGLDTDPSDTNDGITLWRNGGVTSGGGYTPARLNRELRQVRVYALTQIGQRDNFYTYPSTTVYVGDQDLGTGRSVSLTPEQRKYRWRVIRFAVSPRNIR